KVQAQKQNSPVYKVLEELGPAHAKAFTVGVYIVGELLGIGKGKSKQQAEEMAAKQALERKAK
ncbi:MAG: ribonuclease III, partial [Candidatus Levybacteria bacterium CG_4_10_14_0_2_um_filter_35_8]